MPFLPIDCHLINTFLKRVRQAFFLAIYLAAHYQKACRLIGVHQTLIVIYMAETEFVHGAKYKHAVSRHHQRRRQDTSEYRDD